MEREGGDEKERRQQFISEGIPAPGEIERERERERETDTKRKKEAERERERESNLFPTETEKDIEGMRQGN